MADLTVRHIQRYDRAERYRQRIGSGTLSLVISGLTHMTINGHEIDPRRPFLVLSTTGAVIDFEFGADRENWTALFDWPDLRPAREGLYVRLRDGRQWRAIPMIRYLSPADVQHLRTECERLANLMTSPLPAQQLAIAFGVTGLISHLVAGDACATSDPVADHPAYRLRQRLDQDVDERVSLATHSRRCGYTPDHLRILFEEEFGLAPKQYRLQRRMTLAMQHIAGSNDSIKAIAYRLGFASLAHFSSLFRKTFGFPPREAIRRYRQR